MRLKRLNFADVNDEDVFFISKGFARYKVTIDGRTVVVELAQRKEFETQNHTIAQSLEIIVNSRLLIVQPIDVSKFVREHFEAKGWDVA